ncbi:MAG TPA: 30S ribosomal protein S12 methylthiotransferase RimO [Gemmatimonadaceae bacterium]|nr:30S ribosomal protein S12 methylthiotransferase RimO [Gemmatimonadaceae bacterium]
MKVGVVTLGCDKNTVDSERYLAELLAHGAEMAPDLRDAHLIVVNTCGFIDAAKRESIDAIVEAGRLKQNGVCRTLVAIGCMVERHRAELQAALPEVDILLGTSDADRLVDELHARGVIASEVLAHPGTRAFAGDLPHVRYLKVSEGCDHGCAFCAIPLMRGRHRSFTATDIVREAQLLEAQGAREVNLVAQDLAHFGRDTRNGVGLPELLELLLRETSIPWIRLLYLYSAGITPRLLQVVADEDRILPYLDMPMQHAADRVLSRMRRPERKSTIRDKVARYREAVPDVVIRTTCIVGFPGETEEDFEELLRFLAETRFDRVGGFTYSPQDGTRAAELTDDVPESLKRERLERLTELQRSITAERNEERIGRRTSAIVDRVAADSVEARVWWQAHDVDGITLLDTAASPGSIVEVAVTGIADDYDLTASFIREVRSGRAAGKMISLPMLSAGAGSFGR